MCTAHVLEHAISYHTHTTDHLTAIMDSGNNKQHLFNTPTYFPLGYTMHTITITGVSGKQRKKVGIGTAFFNTVLGNGTKFTWIVPHSIYDAACPVNLLCMDLFHFYPSTNTRTGHAVQFLNERILLRHGNNVPMPRNKVSHLYLVTLETPPPHIARSKHFNPTVRTACAQLTSMDTTDSLALYKHNELQPMSTQTALRIFNHPHAHMKSTLILP